MTTPDKSYEILERIARGGMGEVLLARERAGELYERLVVLKVVREQYAEDEELDTAFLDEARLASQLQHPNVAQIYDVARLEGRPTIVMEWLRGRDLARILKALAQQDRAMEPRILVSILLGAVAGLGYAHRAVDSRGQPLGLVHRDISPQNVILTYDGIVKVIDFGIALSRNRITKTTTGLLKGKVPYMAPEQVRGRVDQRTDLWALGAVAWESLVGERLFRSRGDLDIVGAVLEMEIPRPSERRSEVPPALDAIVMGLLERDKRARIQSCKQLERELLACAEHMSLPTPNELGGWLRRLLPDERGPAAAVAQGKEPVSTVHLAPAEPSEGTVTLGTPPAEPATPGGAPAAPAPAGSPAAGAAARPATIELDEPAPLPPGAPAAGRPAGEQAPVPEPETAPTLPRQRGAFKGGRAARWWIAAAVALGAVAGIGAALLPNGDASEPPSAAETEPAPEPTPPAASPPPTETVRFEVKGLPPGGQLVLDGSPREGHVVDVPKQDTLHRLEVRDAEGERIASHELRATKDAVIAVAVARGSRERDEADEASDPSRSERPARRRPRRPTGEPREQPGIVSGIETEYR